MKRCMCIDCQHVIASTKGEMGICTLVCKFSSLNKDVNQPDTNIKSVFFRDEISTYALLGLKSFRWKKNLWFF